MTDIAEFLLTRIAEDERIAHTAAQGERGEAPGWKSVEAYSTGYDAEIHTDAEDDVLLASVWGGFEAEHIARHDPARVLAECEAKRAIIAYCSPGSDARDAASTYGSDSALAAELAPVIDWLANESLAPVLRYLAAPYADHPDYRQEWRP